MTVGSQVKQCAASLKSVKAGLETLAEQSADAQLARELLEAASSFDPIIADLYQRIGVLEREEPQYEGF